MRRRLPELALAIVLVAIAAGLLRLSWNEHVGSVAGPPRGVRSSPAPDSPVRLRLQEVASGLARPLFMTHSGDGSGRLFVVEQGGTIRILTGGELRPEPFLEARGLLDESRGERGLLGLAFAPDYRKSGRFFIAHTAPGPSVRVTRLRASADPDRADPASAEVVIRIPDPASNHNGGMIAFGPDGNLWYGTGDGGRAGDPWNNASNPGALLGKLLRIDVASEPYRIPPENPFADGRAGRPEIWALGLRNPWRFSFDRETGELWIGDVGQNAWEEINVEDPRRGGGRHYGWRTMEGFHCYSPRTGCATEGLTLPIYAYGHDQGCSVTGGYVYRGQDIPELVGTYLFSDYCSGTLWGLRRGAEGEAEVSVLLRTGLAVSSFGEDSAGEVYLCDHRRGRVFRLEGDPGPAGTRKEG
jgi:glucose/arabinose dehydrogenase